jgi:hypothetical protein
MTTGGTAWCGSSARPAAIIGSTNARVARVDDHSQNARTEVAERRHLSMGSIRLEHVESPAGSLERLRRALEDPSLDIIYRRSSTGTWIDELGFEVPQSTVGSGRCVSPLERDGDWVAALIHPPALLDEPRASMCGPAFGSCHDRLLAPRMSAPWTTRGSRRPSLCSEVVDWVAPIFVVAGSGRSCGHWLRGGVDLALFDRDLKISATEAERSVDRADLVEHLGLEARDLRCGVRRD